MKPSYLFVCIFAMLALTSAAKTSKKSEVRIEKSWKKNAKPLAFEEIDTKDLLEFAESCDVFGNILVVENYNNSGKYLLEFVDMNTMEIKRKALMRGNGPGEVTFAIIFVSYDPSTVADSHINIFVQHPIFLKCFNDRGKAKCLKMPVILSFL